MAAWPFGVLSTEDVPLSHQDADPWSRHVFESHLHCGILKVEPQRAEMGDDSCALLAKTA